MTELTYTQLCILIRLVRKEAEARKDCDLTAAYDNLLNMRQERACKDCLP